MHPNLHPGRGVPLARPPRLHPSPRSQVNQKARQAFGQMQAAAMSGNKASYKAGQQELQRLMTITMYQVGAAH